MCQSTSSHLEVKKHVKTLVPKSLSSESPSSQFFSTNSSPFPEKFVEIVFYCAKVLLNDILNTLRRKVWSTFLRQIISCDLRLKLWHKIIFECALPVFGEPLASVPGSPPEPALPETDYFQTHKVNTWSVWKTMMNIFNTPHKTVSLFFVDTSSLIKISNVYCEVIIPQK